MATTACQISSSVYYPVSLRDLIQEIILSSFKLWKRALNDLCMILSSVFDMSDTVASHWEESIHIELSCWFLTWAAAIFLFTAPMTRIFWSVKLGLGRGRRFFLLEAGWVKEGCPTCISLPSLIFTPCMLTARWWVSYHFWNIYISWNCLPVL